MKIKKLTLSTSDVPEKIRNISTPPKKLFILSNDSKELLARPAVAIVGSRKATPYGTAVTASLAGDLARAGVAIVSGLALGIDGIAHKAALEAGGQTIAVLPTGLDHIYPATHRELAKQILEQGGALITEYPEGTEIYRGNFVARNRIISGLSDAVVVTEAAVKSGSLHTADFALDQGRAVLAVPGNITSLNSEGTNSLIKSGAMPVTEAADVLRAIGIEPLLATQKAPRSDNPNEQLLITLLADGLQDGGELLSRSQLDVSSFNQSLTMLEIRGHIRPLGNNQWALQYGIQY
ncbi:MAG TPA: DNA-processing protein DprA [Bacillota bacterium]|nr:DNA-processing protein DprA [Bacillota bacterium]